MTPRGYENWVVIDGLQLSRWDRELLEELRDGGIACVHATCAFWESATEALANIGNLLRLLKENQDLATLIRSRDEILAARENRKVGFLLGFQNSSPFEDDLNLVGAFHELGVRVAQLTYNNHTFVGSSCYEESDAGLTRFGRILVRELNEVGIVVDLSHVGERTSLETIEHSAAPVAITHANPRWFCDVPRNKSNDVIRACVARNGIVGLCIYQLVLPGGAACSWAEFSQMLLRLVDDVGVEHVAVGTDFALKQPPSFIAWLRSGTWTREVQDVREPEWPEWLARPLAFPQFAGRLLELGLTETDARAILGENWLRLLADVEGAAHS
jgi:microsomal dipeptidase-like Zn-dependent dipeptidase